MRVLLISAVFQNRKPVLKFYEPKTEKIILIPDATDYRAHCYVTTEEGEELKDQIGIHSVIDVTIRDVIKDKFVTMSKVTVDNPMIKYDMKDEGKGWETDIKFYQDYLYDNNYVVGTWYDIDKDNITPVPFPNQNLLDLSKIDIETVVDKTKFTHQMDRWASLLAQDIPELKRVAFDIEVESTKQTLPDVNTAEQKVTAISFYGSDGLKQVLMLKRPEVPMGEKDKDKSYTTIYYDNEENMLNVAFKIIDSYPIVLTYNGDMFDMPYLFNRAERLGLEYNPFKMMQRKATLNNGVHIDMYGIFSNPSLKAYAFSAKYIENGLDSVAKAMLGEGKTEYDGTLDQIPLALLAKYCFNDSRLTFELSHFNKDLVMNLLIILARIGNMPIDDISRLRISNWIRSMFYFQHRKNGELIPRSSDFPQVDSSTKAKVEGKKYEGATVIEPTKGIHFGVTVLDFASLYSSIVKNRNLSYETVCCPHEECKTNTIAYTKHWSCTKKIGIASLLIGSLKELRVNHFKVLSKTAKTQEEKDINFIITQALKVYLNASYGVLGADTFALYFLPTAEATTAIGRDMILKTIEAAKSKNLPVLYGDTDSIFVYQPTEEQINYLIDFCKKHYSIDLEVDKEYKYLMLSDRKKNYFGVKKDNTLDIKGLSGKKSNTPPYLRELFYDILERLKIIEIPSDFPPAKKDIETKIKNVVDNFESIPLEKLALRVMINKEPYEYKVEPQVLKAAKQLHKEKGILPEKGMFISFVKTWKKPHVMPVELAKTSDIDKEKYMEGFESVLEQITDPMDISVELLMGKGTQTNLTQW